MDWILDTIVRMRSSRQSTCFCQSMFSSERWTWSRYLKSFLFMGYAMSEDEYEDTEAVIVLLDYTPAKKEQEASSVIVISDSTTSTVFTPTKR